MQKVHIKTYGCQMNVYDSELVAGILSRDGYEIVPEENGANVILITGCTVREHADQRALGYLRQILARKRKNNGLTVGLLGCLGQRLGPELQDTLPDLDLILGPDAYRNLPFLLRNLPKNSFIEAENPLEDYDNIPPLRKKGASAFIAISRGCNNNCSYCIVPYTRGRERSRSVQSIISEVENIIENGFKEVTLLGQNVNSYRNNGVDFPELLDRVSRVKGMKRVRFTTSHPKDLSEGLVHVIRDRENVCSHVHLPVQSGSDRILEIMGREYTAKHYLSLIELMRREIPDVRITTDIISGYPGETEKDHRQTVELVRQVEFDSAFTFKYSPRQGTPAYHLPDDVHPEVKIRRLNEVSVLQRQITARKNQKYIGRAVTVMVETISKRSTKDMLGKTGDGENVIIGNIDVPVGTFCTAAIVASSSQTLFGKLEEVIET